MIYYLFNKDSLHAYKCPITIDQNSETLALKTLRNTTDTKTPALSLYGHFFFLAIHLDSFTVHFPQQDSSGPI